MQYDPHLFVVELTGGRLFADESTYMIDGTDSESKRIERVGCTNRISNPRASVIPFGLADLDSLIEL